MILGRTILQQVAYKKKKKKKLLTICRVIYTGNLSLFNYNLRVSLDRMNVDLNSYYKDEEVKFFKSRDLQIRCGLKTFGGKKKKKPKNFPLVSF